MRCLISRCILLAVFGLLAACQQASAPALTDSSGQPLDTDGKWLLINYWATWCKPCRAEIPELNVLHHELADHNIMVLGYNFDRLEGDALLEAGHQLDIGFPHLSSAAIAQLGLPGVAGIPVTFLVNPAGEYSARLNGEQDRASLLAALQNSGALTP